MDTHFFWTRGVFIRSHKRDVFRISGISAQPFVPIIKRVQAARPSSIVWYVSTLQCSPQWSSVKHIPKTSATAHQNAFLRNSSKGERDKISVSAHRLSEKVCLRALGCVCCWTKTTDDIVNKAALTTVKHRLQFEWRGKRTLIESIRRESTKRWNRFLHVDVSHACSTQRESETQLSAKSPIPFFFTFRNASAKALLFFVST